jgi:thioredoxin 1
MHAQPVTDEDFAGEVLESELPVLVDFWSPGCRPCSAMAPIVDEIALELRGRLHVVTANVMDAQENVVRFGVAHAPTFVVIHRGKVVSQLSGLRTKEELLDAVAPALLASA